jgi:multicomponent Na+:H+ antiporter subunit E
MTTAISWIGSQVTRLGRLVVFGLYFVYELTIASLEVAWDVITPRSRLRSGIVEIRMNSESPTEMTLMANLVSLTPGTLSVTINEDRAVLYVHGMYVGDANSFRDDLLTFERRMLWAVRTRTRPEGVS